MPVYRYQARGSHGDSIVGELEAVNADTVASQLLDNGLVPVNIDPVEPTSAAELKWERLFAEKVKDTDLIQFSRQMYSLLKAGVPILTALTGLQQTTRNTALSTAIGGLFDSLRSGRDLATAMSEHPQVFNLFYISMIKVGETSGSLDAVLLQLAKYLERDKKTKEQIKSAIRYPMFVIAAIGLALVIINLFVIPEFASLFAKLGGELPWASKILMGVSQFTVRFWPVLLLLTVAAVSGTRYYLGTVEGRYLWDKTKLKLPLVGCLIHKATMARFTRLMAMSMRAGVPLITGLTVVARALDNTYVEDRVLNMRSGIERGESINRSATTVGIFDHLVLQMIDVGEQSGALDNLLQEVAEYYELEVGYELDRISASIEPILTVVIGVIVLILALGVFLPMWNIANVALQK